MTRIDIIGQNGNTGLHYRPQCYGSFLVDFLFKRDCVNCDYIKGCQDLSENVDKLDKHVGGLLDDVL